MENDFSSTKMTVFFALVFSVLLTACGNKEAEIQEALRLEVFAVHDEVMPKTADINRLKAALKQLPADSVTLDSTALAAVNAAILQLEKADDGMMRWMVEFKHPERLRDSLSHEEIMAYLNAQKQQIGQVRAAMLSSIETAKKLLKQE